MWQNDESEMLAVSGTPLFWGSSRDPWQTHQKLRPPLFSALRIFFVSAWTRNVRQILGRFARFLQVPGEPVTATVT